MTENLFRAQPTQSYCVALLDILLGSEDSAVNKRHSSCSECFDKVLTESEVRTWTVLTLYTFL